MKKIILLLFIVLSSSVVIAQGIDLGIKAGANFADITDVDNASSRSGLIFGAFATLKFSDKIAIQGDLLYSQKGTEDIDLDYINLPVVFKYYLVKRLNIHAGPQFGINIKDDDTDSEPADVSGVVGLGVDLPLGFRIDGRYNFGLTKIIDQSNSKHSVISIAVGWTII